MGLPADVSAAVNQGDAHALAAWLDEGGGVDARCAERDGETLLMMAAGGGQEAMVRMLLQRGASINLQDSLDSTALMHAAVKGHTTTVQALLDAKADTLLQSKSGGTALILAEQQKRTAAAQLLRQHAKPQAPRRPHVSGSLSGRRVRIAGLKGRPELNGRCGVAAYSTRPRGGTQ